jgi:hypothetical protein
VRNLTSKIAALLMAGAAAVTLAPSASAAPLPHFSTGTQLADNAGRSELGTEQFTKLDPDSARINLSPAFGKATVATAPSVRKSQGAAVNAPARTSNLDGFCDFFSNGLGDFCIWETDDFSGGVADFFNAEANLFGARFPGTNISVGANAVSGFNQDSFRFLLAYTGMGFTGVAGFAGPGEGGVFAAPFLRNIGSIEFV